MSKEAMKLALEALEESLGYVEEEAENAQRLYGQYPTRQARIQGLKDDVRKHMHAITALRYAIQDQESYAAAYPDNFVKRASEAFEEALERGWKGLAEEVSQVVRVWWDGDKLIMQPVSVNDMYETAPLETQPPKDLTGAITKTEKNT